MQCGHEQHRARRRFGRGPHISRTARKYIPVGLLTRNILFLLSSWKCGALARNDARTRVPASRLLQMRVSERHGPDNLCGCGGGVSFREPQKQDVFVAASRDGFTAVPKRDTPAATAHCQSSAHLRTQTNRSQTLPIEATLPQVHPRPAREALFSSCRPPAAS